MSLDTLTSDEVTNLIETSKLPILVDFFAPWCGPCKIITPILEDLCEEYKEKITIVKVNADNSSDVSAKYGVRSIPTMLFFHVGHVVNTKVGAASKKQIETLIKEVIL